MTLTFKFFSLRMSEYEEISVLWLYCIIWQKWRDLSYVFNICIQVKLVNQKDCPVWSRPNQTLWKRTEDFSSEIGSCGGPLFFLLLALKKQTTVNETATKKWALSTTMGTRKKTLGLNWNHWPSSHPGCSHEILSRAQLSHD